MQIIFENNHLLLATKPFGRSTQSDVSGLSFLDDVKNFIRKRDNKQNPYLGLVHRLDRDVGGLIVLAKNSKTSSRLSEQIRESKFKKFYIAEAQGILSDESGKLEHYLIHDESKKMAIISSNQEKGAKLAQLNYQVLYNSDISSIVLVELITGRYHQIRAQFADIGHPLIGDKLYNYQKTLKPSLTYKLHSVPTLNLSTELKFSIIKNSLPEELINFWDLFECKFEFARSPIHLVSSVIGFDNIRIKSN